MRLELMIISKTKSNNKTIYKNNNYNISRLKRISKKTKQKNDKNNYSNKNLKGQKVINISNNEI